MIYRIICMTAVLSMLVCAVAQADVDQDAKTAFSEGQKFFENSRYDDAAVAFQRAYDLKPTWKLLYNIAQAQAAAKDYAGAVQNFEQYIARGGDEIPLTRLDEVRLEIARLRDMLGTIDLMAPDGCALFLDDRTAGTTPLAGPLRLTAGIRRQLRIECDGEIRLDRKVLVGSRETIRVEVPVVGTASVDTTPSVDAPAVAGAGTVSSDRKRPLRVAGWIAAGLGAGALIGGGIAGGLALKWNSDLGDSESCGDGECGPDAYDTMDRRDSAAAASTILLGVGGALAVTGAVLLIVDHKKNNEKLSIRPLLGNSLAGAMLQGRF